MSEDITPYNSKTRGGRKADPMRGKSANRTVKLYDDEVIALRGHYGSLTKAIRHALTDIPGYVPPAQTATKKK